MSKRGTISPASKALRRSPAELDSPAATTLRDPTAGDKAMIRKRLGERR